MNPIPDVEAPVSETCTPQEQHREDGTFRPGNKGGPGNPFARQVGQLRKQILEALGTERFGNVLEAIIAKAEKGDIPAAKLRFQYALGKPGPTVEPDRLDLEEFKLKQESAIEPTTWTDTFQKLDVATVNGMHDQMWPCIQKQILDPLLAGLLGKVGLTGKAARKAGRRAMNEAYRQQQRPSPKPSNGEDAPSPKPSIGESATDTGTGAAARAKSGLRQSAHNG